MRYEVLYNFWLICCTIIGRLFCEGKGGCDLVGPLFIIAPILDTLALLLSGSSFYLRGPYRSEPQVASICCQR